MENYDNRSGQPARRRRRKKRRKMSMAFVVLSVIFCTLIMLIQVAGGAFLCLELYDMDMLPVRYLIVIAAVVLIMAVIQIGLIVQRSKPSFLISAILGMCFIGVVALGIVYVQKTEETLNAISDAQKVHTTLDQVSIAVKADSTYEELTDLNGLSFGVQASVDRTNTDKTMDSLKDLLSDDMTTHEYNGIYDMVQAFYEGTDDVIVFNEAYRELITDSFSTFEDDVRIINTYTYASTEVVEEEVEEEETEAADEEEQVDVITMNPFVIYMSGIDTYGDVATKSRSDVNILAVVNPQTKQILLVTTPRDYYVALALDGDPMDKLTHAGIYGIDCSIKTLENLYGVSVDYYLRLNFTGFMDIVDALDGVDVESEQAFTGEVGNYSFEVGTNHVNGKQALCFVRERHSFVDGDAQRARNQMAMIKAVVAKASSPAILTSYTDVLESISDSFMTSMSKNTIAKLVKYQLQNDVDWDVQTYSTNGTGARRTTYSMGSLSLYVALEDEESVAQASEYMNAVLNGEIIEIPHDDEEDSE